MLAFKYYNHRSIEHLKDADPVHNSSYSWHSSDPIYMYDIALFER